MCAIVDILLVLIVILIIVLVWRGPSMLPQFGEALGKAVRGARQTMDRDAADESTSDTSATPKDDQSDTATGP
jgi:Sec-independent protein translocase protein TatA